MKAWKLPKRFWKFITTFWFFFNYFLSRTFLKFCRKFWRADLKLFYRTWFCARLVIFTIIFCRSLTAHSVKLKRKQVNDTPSSFKRRATETSARLIFLASKNKKMIASGTKARRWIISIKVQEKCAVSNLSRLLLHLSLDTLRKWIQFS